MARFKKKWNNIKLSLVQKLFDQSSQRSFTESILRTLIKNEMPEWNFEESITAGDIIDYLLFEDLLQVNSISDDDQHKLIYTWKSNDLYTVISGLKNNSYFCFYTAVHFHQLTLQIPKTIYLNFEHTSVAYNEDALTQESIDAAFSNPQRKSSKQFGFRGNKIIITNSRYTGRLGVMCQKSADQLYYYTDLERTLIDITTRPVYSGGVFEILNCYIRAKGSVDLEKMSSYLKKMNFVYPYAQSIGYYLESAGYDQQAQSIFESDKAFDFYLTYNMRSVEYSEKWKLYVPKGMSAAAQS